METATAPATVFRNVTAAHMIQGDVLTDSRSTVESVTTWLADRTIPTGKCRVALRDPDGRARTTLFRQSTRVGIDRTEQADRRSRLAGTHVTLDGKAASIVGFRLDYGIVAALDGSARFEWAWPTIERVVAAGGDFRS